MHNSSGTEQQRRQLFPNKENMAAKNRKNLENQMVSLRRGNRIEFIKQKRANMGQ